MRQHPEDSDDHNLKKWEELYSFSKDALIQIGDRFDVVEEKSARHFTFLGVLLGAMGVGLPDILKIILAPQSKLGGLLVLCYLLLALLVIIAMWMHIASLHYSALKELPLNKQLIDHFKQNRYVDVLFSLSKGNIDAAKTNLECLQHKLSYGKEAYTFTKLALFLAVIVGILYAVYRLNHPELWAA